MDGTLIVVPCTIPARVVLMESLDVHVRRSRPSFYAPPDRGPRTIRPRVAMVAASQVAVGLALIVAGHPLAGGCWLLVGPVVGALACEAIALLRECWRLLARFRGVLDGAAEHS